MFTCASCGFERPGIKNCSKCKSALYCSSECQTDHWAVHKPVCRRLAPGEVWGIEVLSKGGMRRAGVEKDDARFRHVLLQPGHPALARAEVCPATAAAGLPIKIYSPVIHSGQASQDERDDTNQPAVFLRVETDNGLAPPLWQVNHPGTCIIYRADRRVLTRETAETLWEWIAMLMSDAMGYPEGDGWAPMSEFFTPSHWQLFARHYYQGQKEKGRVGFNEVYVPL